jgi:hypothetical protein
MRYDFLHQSDSMIENHIRQAIVREATAGLVGDGRSAAIAIPSQKPIHCCGVIAISSAPAVNLSLSSHTRTPRRFSLRLLIVTMLIETASELPKRGRN